MDLPVSVVGLNNDQKNRLVQLWKTQCRPILDVKLSRDAMPTSNKKSNQQPPFSNDTYNFMVRLHYYLVSYLEQIQNITSNSQQHHTTDNEQTKQAGSYNNSLRSFAQLAYGTNRLSIDDERNRKTKENNTLDQQTIKIRKRSVRLLDGRHVLTIHHEEFVNELNRFEVKDSLVSEEFIRKHSFGSFLYFKPDLAILALGCSMSLAISSMYEQQQKQLEVVSSPTATSTNRNGLVDNNSTGQDFTNEAIGRYVDSTQIIIRFAHVYPQIQMMDIKTGLVGKFVSLKGHVVKSRPKRLRVATADFLCQNCGTIVTHHFDQGLYTLPTKCVSATTSSNINSNDASTIVSSNCRSKSFTLIRPTARYINAQEIRLQEAQEESTMQAGRTPRQIDVELTDDLVNTCRPGDIVLVAGVVTAINTALAAGTKGKKAVQETSTYKIFLIGNSITTMSETNNNHSSNRKRKTSTLLSQSTYTQQQLRNIVQLCHADHRYFSLVERRAFPFDLLVRSLCPSIIGHHEVKAGLMLCLLGGTPSSLQSSGMLDKGVSIRSNSHILIVGDPGMGTFHPVILRILTSANVDNISQRCLF